MLRFTSVPASEIVIGEVANKFKLPCQRVHAVTVTVCRPPHSNRRCKSLLMENEGRGDREKR